MNKKILSLLTVWVLTLAMFSACQKVAETNEDDDSDGDNTVYEWDTSAVVQITLADDGIAIDPLVANINGSKVTITSSGTYNIKGSLSDGQIVVNSDMDGNVRLIFDGLDIKCSDSAPVYIKDADKTIIDLAEGTENYLTDGTTYTTSEDGEPCAALFSNSDLVIYGEGSLNIKANYNDGISSDDGLIIKSGTISVTAADDGIRGKDYIIVENGNITVNSAGDAMKSDNETDTSLGYISVTAGNFNLTAKSGDGLNAATDLSIAGGTFTITTGGGASATSTSTSGGGRPGGGSQGGYSGTISVKAIKAGSNIVIDKGTFTISSADDALHSAGNITVNDGTLGIATGDDAIHGETTITINGGTLNITKCYEGLEGPSITVNKGTVNLVSTDDGFNATKGSATETNDGSFIYLNGGNIMVNSSAGDAIDSNGSVIMKGGTVVAHGPQSAPEVGFDVNGTFTISGGFLIVTGPNSGNMIETPGSSSSQYCIKATCSSTLSSSTLFHIQDAGGNNIVTFKPVRSVYYLVISSSDFTNGATYNIYTGGSSTGNNENGLYTGGSYSGGTLKKSFTISGKITNVTF